MRIEWKSPVTIKPLANFHLKVLSKFKWATLLNLCLCAGRSASPSTSCRPSLIASKHERHCRRVHSTYPTLTTPLSFVFLSSTLPYASSFHFSLSLLFSSIDGSLLTYSFVLAYISPPDTPFILYEFTPNN